MEVHASTLKKLACVLCPIKNKIKNKKNKTKNLKILKTLKKNKNFLKKLFEKEKIEEWLF
jgi:hypothetical protein